MELFEQQLFECVFGEAEMVLGNKGRYVMRILLAGGGVYLAFRYLLPLVLPFLGAYALAYMLSPIVTYLARKTRIKKQVVTAGVLGIVVVCFVLFFGMFLTELIRQLTQVIQNAAYYEGIIDGTLLDICGRLEHTLGIGAQALHYHILDGMSQFMNDYGKELLVRVMGTSASTLRFFAKAMIFLVTLIMAAFYMIVSREELRRKKRESIFYKEISQVLGNVYQVSVTYVRTQGMIMLVTMILCYLGFCLMGNPYALVLSVGIGVMDALPLLGVGIVLVPWCIILFFWKQYRKAWVVFGIFLLCYGFRELAEPRLMGKGIGISPLMTIVAIYAGLQLFGLWGVILGPIGWVILRQILAMTDCPPGAD